MIDSIQIGMKNAVGNMESGVRQVDNGVVLANDAGVSIGRIREGRYSCRTGSSGNYVCFSGNNAVPAKVLR